MYAIKIRRRLKGFRGNANLYKLSEALFIPGIHFHMLDTKKLCDDIDYIIISSALIGSLHEIAAFVSDCNGKIQYPVPIISTYSGNDRSLLEYLGYELKQNMLPIKRGNNV